MSEHTDGPRRHDGHEDELDFPQEDPQEDPLADPVEEHLGVGADPEPGRDPDEPSDLARPRPDDDEPSGG
ncbi:hypothetical protein GCM10028777_28050 [Angustibacter speluncae]